MITREKRLRKYCINFQEIENYEEAVQSPELYDLHHRKEIDTLEDGTVVLRSKKKLKELNLYMHRPPEDLIFLKHSEHSTMHHKMMIASAETRAKMSSSKLGDKNFRWKGDLVSDSAKRARRRRQKRRELLSSQ